MDWISLATNFMQLHSTSVQLFLLLLVAINALLLRRWSCSSRRSFTHNWPPGPRAWPIIGHFHLLGKLPHHSLCKLSSTYGPLMGLRLGSVRAIVASSSQMAKEILQTHDLTFAHRPRLTAAIHLGFNCAGMAFNPNYGPLQKLMRRVCATELFTAKRLASFRHVREDEVWGMVRALAEMGNQGKKAVELRPSLVAATNNIMCRMVMGKKIADVSTIRRRNTLKMGPTHDLLSLIGEVVHLVGVFYIGDVIPWLWWLDPHRYLKRMKVVGLALKALMEDVIHERRQERGKRVQEDQDLLDVLLAAAANPQLAEEDVCITDDTIMATILDLFVAGTDTSSISVEWALADIVSNDRVMHKLQKEINNVVGTERLVRESDIENLPYLALVIKESMRLHPVAPLLIPHESHKECQIGDYKIPAKTRAYVNVWAIGRDPLLWERPLEFWPERIENRNLDLRGQNFELLPFGTGRRGCPGRAIALLNVSLMLANLVQGFKFSLGTPDNQNHDYNSQPPDMSESFGLAVVMKKPLCIFLTPKLPVHLY